MNANEKTRAKEAFRNTASDFVIREQAAYQGFSELLASKDFTQEQALKVWNFYISRKVLIVSLVAGGWTVKSGNLLDNEVIQLIVDTADLSTIKIGRQRRK